MLDGVRERNRLLTLGCNELYKEETDQCARIEELIAELAIVEGRARDKAREVDEATERAYSHLLIIRLLSFTLCILFVQSVTVRKELRRPQ
jgi:hypothetical protein